MFYYASRKLKTGTQKVSCESFTDFYCAYNYNSEANNLSILTWLEHLSFHLSSHTYRFHLLLTLYWPSDTNQTARRINLYIVASWLISLHWPFLSQSNFFHLLSLFSLQKPSLTLVLFSFTRHPQVMWATKALLLVFPASLNQLGSVQPYLSHYLLICKPAICNWIEINACDCNKCNKMSWSSIKKGMYKNNQIQKNPSSLGKLCLCIDLIIWKYFFLPSSVCLFIK